MIRMQVFIPDDLYKNLKSISKRTDVPMAAYIRQGLQLVLGRKKLKELDPYRDFIGQAKTSKKTNAVHDIKEYYRA